MSAVSESLASTQDSSRPTLLVVDDQAINIRVLHRVFSSDYKVLMAMSGAMALQLCRSHLPDLVLLDVLMPDMDGHEVCRQLKVDPRTRDIPVIFVTAQDGPARETLGLELGAVDFILKPINPAVVRARVKTHLAFARASSLLSTTLESVAEGIVVIDHFGAISHMNLAFIRLWNLPRELQDRQASGAALLEFMLAQTVDAELYGRQLAAAMDGEHLQSSFEAIELQGDRHLERQIRPFRINATLGGHVFSYRDVTEHRRAEARLRLLNETLESRILERTRALEAAMHHADAANRAKSEFLSNMSHEIRTPLNGVIGMTHLALKADPNARQRDYLNKIRGAGQHLLSLVNNILDFSKIEAGELCLEDTEFVLDEVFNAVASQLDPAARAKGLTLRFHSEPGLHSSLCGDPLRIRQVLLNYVCNAIKFSVQGEVLVRAVPMQCAEPGALVRFEVRDCGPGLSEAQLALLFQPFHQADASTTRLHGGTGLGLAISRQLATLMGGEVGVESLPGEGSMFWFSAQLHPAPPAEAHTDGRKTTAHGPASIGSNLDVIKDARILVAEDNLLNQQVAVDLLEDVGARVRLASNGQEAIDLLQQRQFDCVLMDLQMPTMDGLQATRFIQTQPQLARIPIIAVTANASKEDRNRCLEAGMVDFISKPFDPEHFYATVVKWLSPTHGKEPLADAVAASDEWPVQTAAAVDLSASDADTLDLSVLSRNVAGNHQRMRKYAAMFADSIPETLAELQSTLALADISKLTDLAHRLKASSRMVGAMGFAAMCQSLEELQPDGTLEQAAAIVHAMPAHLSKISAAIGKGLA